MIIGNSRVNDADGMIEASTVWGFIGPRTEYMTIRNTKFYNFDFEGSAAIGTCSHCFHPAATDSGTRTMTTNNLEFDEATVPRKLLYQEPWREIIYDQDGSLTNMGAGSWATFHYPHLEQPECTVDLDQYDGVICDNTV